MLVICESLVASRGLAPDISRCETLFVRLGHRNQWHWCSLTFLLAVEPPLSLCSWTPCLRCQWSFPGLEFWGISTCHLWTKDLSVTGFHGHYGSRGLGSNYSRPDSHRGSHSVLCWFSSFLMTGSSQCWCGEGGEEVESYNVGCLRARVFRFSSNIHMKLLVEVIHWHELCIVVIGILVISSSTSLSQSGK